MDQSEYQDKEIRFLRCSVTVLQIFERYNIVILSKIGKTTLSFLRGILISENEKRREELKYGRNTKNRFNRKILW